MSQDEEGQARQVLVTLDLEYHIFDFVNYKQKLNQNLTTILLRPG